MATIIKTILCIGLLVFPHITLGYFYNLCVMKKVQKNQVQFIVGLGDYHDKTHAANKVHRVYLYSLLKICALLKGKFIVEDLSSINNDGKMVCFNYGVNTSDGVLGKLAHKARKQGVMVDNVEYRFCRVASIAPLLNNVHASPYDFEQTVSIPTSALHQEVSDELGKIKKYNDNFTLNSMYKRVAAIVSRDLAKIDFNKDRKSVAQYCAGLNHKHYRKELERLCIFDSPVIDAHIMHSIAIACDKPVIFVVAGGSHIEQMYSMLKRTGYKPVFEKWQDSSSGVKKVLNFDNPSVSSEALPQAIDLAVIDKFIKGLL